MINSIFWANWCRKLGVYSAVRLHTPSSHVTGKLELFEHHRTNPHIYCTNSTHTKLFTRQWDNRCRLHCSPFSAFHESWISFIYNRYAFLVMNDISDQILNRYHQQTEESSIKTVKSSKYEDNLSVLIFLLFVFIHLHVLNYQYVEEIQKKTAVFRLGSVSFSLQMSSCWLQMRGVHMSISRYYTFVCEYNIQNARQEFVICDQTFLT